MIVIAAVVAAVVVNEMRNLMLVDSTKLLD
jgi:hypothetical protein